MNGTEILELAAARALGVLEPADSPRLDALVVLDPGILSEVQVFEAVVAALLLRLPRIQPPDRLRGQVLKRIRSTPQHPSVPDTNIPRPAMPDPSGFRFLRPSEGSWSPGPHPGTRIQVLSTDVRRNYMLLYIELEPGAKFPEHDHRASEELYVVSGDLMTEGRLLHAGDFVHGDPGSHHHELVSPGGCQAILLTSLTSAIGDTAKASLKRTAGQLLGGLGLGPRG